MLYSPSRVTQVSVHARMVLLCWQADPGSIPAAGHNALRFDGNQINLDRRGMEAHVTRDGLKKPTRHLFTCVLLFFHLQCLFSPKINAKGDRCRVSLSCHSCSFLRFLLYFLPSFTLDLFDFSLDVVAQWELFWPVLWKWWRPGCSPPPLLFTSLKSSSVLWMELALLAWLLRVLCIVSSKENFSR